MQIYGPSQAHGPQALNAPHAARPARTQPTQATTPVGDQLDISEAAQLAAQVNDLPDVRLDRVAELRAEIASGNYETEARLSGAVDRLLDEIG